MSSAPSPISAMPISVGPTYLQPTGADSTAELQGIFANASNKTLDLAPGIWGINKMLTLANLTGVVINAHGATLKALPQLGNGTQSNVLLIQACDGVTVNNLAIDGNASQRGPFTGNGSNICLNWSKNLKFNGIVSRNALCDDYLVWGGCDNPGGPCFDGEIVGGSMTGAGRNSISFIDAVRWVVKGVNFAGVNGESPKTAIDCEPGPKDGPGCCSDILISRNTFTNCYRAVYAQNITNTAPTGLTCVENQITNCDIGIESQWASTIALNTFRQIKSIRICTGSYSPGASSRIWRNSNDGTGVDSLAACDVVA